MRNVLLRLIHDLLQIFLDLHPFNRVQIHPRRLPLQLDCNVLANFLHPVRIVLNLMHRFLFKLVQRAHVTNRAFFRESLDRCLRSITTASLIVLTFSSCFHHVESADCT